MSSVPSPVDQSQRLQSLAEHNLLDTLPEQVYDDITRLAAEICGTPIAAINLIAEDRHWSKSAHGFDGGSLPLEHSYCAHTILNPEQPLVVSDLRYDERFSNNPLTVNDPHIKFYAGVPVKDAEGRALGSLCVLDSRPRELPEHKLESLKALAKLVNTHFQLRRTKIELEKAQQQVDAAQPILRTLMSALDEISKEVSQDKAGHLHYLQQGVASLRDILVS